MFPRSRFNEATITLMLKKKLWSQVKRGRSKTNGELVLKRQVEERQKRREKEEERSWKETFKERSKCWALEQSRGCNPYQSSAAGAKTTKRRASIIGTDSIGDTPIQRETNKQTKLRVRTSRLAKKICSRSGSLSNFLCLTYFFCFLRPGRSLYCLFGVTRADHFPSSKRGFVPPHCSHQERYRRLNHVFVCSP